LTELLSVVNAVGLPIALLLAGAIWIGKNWERIATRIAPAWSEARREKQKAAAFAREQKAQAAAMTFEQQERRDTIRVLMDTHKSLEAERKFLQAQLLEIIKEQGRRDERLVGALQNMSQLITLQTRRLDQHEDRMSEQTAALTALTVGIERIVGSASNV